MPGWAALLGVFGYNYSRYRRGLPTICATTRRLLPRSVAAVALCVGFAYLLGHVLNGYPPRPSLERETPPRRTT